MFPRFSVHLVREALADTPVVFVMDACLSCWLGAEVKPQNEHKWDAAISILPVVRGLNGSWQRDLYDLPTDPGERLVHPCAKTTYMWPE